MDGETPLKIDVQEEETLELLKKQRRELTYKIRGLDRKIRTMEEGDVIEKLIVSLMKKRGTYASRKVMKKVVKL